MFNLLEIVPLPQMNQEFFAFMKSANDDLDGAQLSVCPINSYVLRSCGTGVAIGKGWKGGTQPVGRRGMAETDQGEI